MISILNYIQQYVNGPSLNNNFLINKALLGVKKNRSSLDTRAPITSDMLRVMLSKVSNVSSNVYIVSLLKSMYTLAFYGFLRIGEMTKTGNEVLDKHVLQLSNVHIKPDEKSVVITFNSYKHMSGNVPFSLTIKSDESQLSVVKLLAEYLQLRGYKNGALYLLPNSKPITRNLFNKYLEKVIKDCNFNLKIKSHSFRIGAATTAIENGYSNEQVQIMGRWRSNAFKKYVRVTSMSHRVS